MTPTITIVFTVNDSYAQHCCVAMVSVLENNKQSSFDFYILTDYFSEANQELFRQTVKHYGDQHQVYFILVDPAPLQSLPLTIDHITLHTYYRFLIPQLLPQHDKVLYLDADLVVDGSLEELWTTPLDGYLCAGVEDTYILRDDYRFRVGFTRKDLYINAGVILLNTALMRQEDGFSTLMQTAHERAHTFDYQDQDILNYAFRGRIKQVAEIYNFASANAKKNPKATPTIIHYTGPRKPWSTATKCHHSFAKVYFKYLRLTPYKGFRYQYITNRLICKIQKALGLSKVKSVKQKQ